MESFAKSLTQTIRDACSCTFSAAKVSSSSSTILCSGEGNGNFVTKLRVKDKEEEKKIICSLSERIKKGSVPTNGMTKISKSFMATCVHLCVL